MCGHKLECHGIVLRAVIRRSDVDQDSGRILARAFLLRQNEQGLSVNYECTPQECAAQFKKCHGVASLHVGRVRNLGLDVVPDEPHHANILGLPHRDDDPATAERMARLLLAQARLVWQR